MFTHEIKFNGLDLGEILKYKEQRVCGILELAKQLEVQEIRELERLTI